MPRPKRTVRAAGVSRSLTGQARNPLVRCLCCGRWLPRTAIAHVGRRPWTDATGKVWPRAFCGECYHGGAVWRDPWVVELEAERKAGK